VAAISLGHRTSCLAKIPVADCLILSINVSFCYLKYFEVFYGGLWCCLNKLTNKCCRAQTRADYMAGSFCSNNKFEAY
jgi:hypothetical protein